MYFCPKCHFFFDINKTSNINSSSSKEVLKRVVDAFKIYESNEDLSLYKALFKFDDLTKNTKYKKLTTTEQEKFNKLFEENIHTDAEFKCSNCNFVKEITETVLLYSFDTSENNNICQTKDLEENELITKNPILPRTHDYICKNVSCISNTTSDIKKEAVFFRCNNSFKIIYICTLCYASW
jgi:hypothetical protein